MKFGALMNNKQVRHFRTKFSFMLNVTDMSMVPVIETVCVTVFRWGGIDGPNSRCIVYESETIGNDSSTLKLHNRKN
jgi:hypothetical protein